MITCMYVHTGGISCTLGLHVCMYILEVFHVHMITCMYVHTGGISCTHDYMYVCTYWRYFMFTYMYVFHVHLDYMYVCTYWRYFMYT